MNAIQFLKQEHVKAKGAFKEIEAAAPPQRGGLWGKLRPELEIHEKMEEQHLYGPAAREVQGDRSLAEWETKHRHEVQEAEGLIRQISGLEPADDRWLQTVKKLRGALEHHIQEEEQDIWPKIERAWSADRLEEAGRQMEAMKHGEAAAVR